MWAQWYSKDLEIPSALDCLYGMFELSAFYLSKLVHSISFIKKFFDDLYYIWDISNIPWEVVNWRRGSLVTYCTIMRTRVQILATLNKVPLKYQSCQCFREAKRGLLRLPDYQYSRVKCELSFRGRPCLKGIGDFRGRGHWHPLLPFMGMNRCTHPTHGCLLTEP